MGYIENNLMQDEQVVHTGYVHGFSLMPGLLTLAIGAVLVSFPITNPDEVPPAAKMFCILLGALFVLSGLYHALSAVIRKLTTELALTTKRVMAKSGLIVRELVELNYNRVESFTVDQSILGMVFGYGTFYIHGVGGSKAGVQCIAAPMDFRRAALEMLDKVTRQKDDGKS
ncbi:MAG: PH domain-containing protein [Alphaproteobacteria bacterium]